ncbi:TPA: hypothetical protein KOS81_002540 [Clostridioides difficile]|nr:hypothetical protein [Clostridioides difficile]HBY3545531.1 hypothetical protein [Clostridioides difficile]
MTEKLTDNASLEELMTALQSVQNDFQTGKNNMANVLGSPFLSTDKLSTTKTKIETLKNTFATNLTNKNVSASKTESMQSLIGKVASIKNILKVAKSEDNSIYLGSSYVSVYNSQTGNSASHASLEINSLSFRPNLVFMIADDSYSNYTTIAFDATMNLMPALILCTEEQYRASNRENISRYQNRIFDTDTYSNPTSAGFFVNGFRTPFYLSKTTSKVTVSWFAIKYE